MADVKPPSQAAKSKFHLYASNRTENLLSQLSSVIKANRQSRSDIFERETFLIQSQGMERLISQAMSNTFQSWCNFKYYLPVGFLRFLGEKLQIDCDDTVYSRDAVMWRLEQMLRNVEEDEFQVLARYLQGQNKELKRFQLARQLANIFDQYQLMRCDLLDSWEKGHTDSSHQAEPWQMLLWQRLQTACGDQPHRGKYVQKIIERLNEADCPGLPANVYIFGLSTMVPMFLQCLSSLALRCDVHLFVLSPCKEYWGDALPKRKSIKMGLSSSVSKQDMLPQIFHHPLLVVYGQQGRIFQEMLLGSVEPFSEKEEYHVDEKPAKILHVLQQDLLHDQVKGSVGASDDSIQIVSCHSRYREMMVLRDHLLQLFYENQQIDLKDVVVMAPDIQEYASIIPAIFHDIQHSIADRSTRNRNRAFAIFVDFLLLFKGRFGWDEVLEVLNNDRVYPQFELSRPDVERIQGWVVDSGIRWGLSAEHRRKAGLPEYEENSWKAGIDRMLLGYAMEGGGAYEDIFPYHQIEGAGAQILGGLCAFIDCLEQGCQLFSGRHTADKWVQHLLYFCGRLFGESGGGDVQELRTILLGLSENTSSFYREDICFEVILDWLEHAAKETRSSSGFLRGQVTFCSMLPMRSIPFKVVCLVGLNDGEFPKNDKCATFDLMGAAPRLGDRSARNDDRYQFLEAILSARECLYLSYVGQSIHSNDTIPPSVVVSELVEVLEENYGIKDLVVQHPLQPFNRDYFTEETSHLFSFSSQNCEVAKRLATHGNSKKSEWWQGRLVAPEKRIQLDALLRFYAHPQRWFVRQCLGINLQYGQENVPDAKELFEFDPLGNHAAKQTVLTALLEDDDLGDLVRFQMIEGRWPLGEPGRRTLEEKEGAVSKLVQTIEGFVPGKKVANLAFEFDLNGYTLYGTLTNLHENGVVYTRVGKCKGSTVLCSWLTYLVLKQHLLELSMNMLERIIC